MLCPTHGTSPHPDLCVKCNISNNKPLGTLHEVQYDELHALQQAWDNSHGVSLHHSI